MGALTTLLFSSLMLSLGWATLVPQQWPRCTFVSDDGATTYDVSVLDAPGGIIPSESVGVDDTMFYNFCTRVGPYWDCSDCSNLDGCSKDAANIMNEKDYDFCFDTGFCCYQYGNGTDMVGPTFDVAGPGTWELVFSPEEVDSPYRLTRYLFVCNPAQSACKPKVKLGVGRRESDDKKYDYANITVECDVACGIPTPERFELVEQVVCTDKACSESCVVNNFTTGTCLLTGDGGSMYMKFCDDTLGLVQLYYQDSVDCRGEAYQFSNPTNTCEKAAKDEFFTNVCKGRPTDAIVNTQVPRANIQKPVLKK